MGRDWLDDVVTCFLVGLLYAWCLGLIIAAMGG